MKLELVKSEDVLGRTVKTYSISKYMYNKGYCYLTDQIYKVIKFTSIVIFRKQNNFYASVII